MADAQMVDWLAPVCGDCSEALERRGEAGLRSRDDPCNWRAVSGAVFATKSSDS
jgi:hypothetical protein